MSDGIAQLKSALPNGSWTDDSDIIAPHLTEWRDKYFGHTPLMLTPRHVSEVVQMVKICAAHKIPIVPQGGNTGLVGGQTPMGEVLMSLRKMTAIREISATNNAMIAEAGASLASVQAAADAAQRKFPLSLASEGSCTVGGVISTNAGGVHVLKYGTTKDLVFGVEAVLADGSIYNGLTSLRKDNTGYDLSRLFLGAEGTLGIVTAASLKLFPKPNHVQRVICGLKSTEDALRLLDAARFESSLAMFEVVPKIGMDLVTTHIPGQRYPFDGPHDWFALIDWEVDSPETGEAIANDVLERAFAAGIIADAIIAQNESQAAQLLALRENMSAAQKYLGGSIKQDITVPIDKIPEFFARADAAVETLVSGCRPVGFGHFGDGNIHYNIGAPVNSESEVFLGQWKMISDSVFDIVDDLGGSISAEHGIGVMKRDDLAERSDSVKMTLLRSVKNALDPDSIMNPRVLV